MQYAIIQLPLKDGGTKKVIIDAIEHFSLQDHQATFEEIALPPEYEGWPFYVCYGSYKPQPGTDPTQAVADLQDAKDHWLGWVLGDKGHTIAFHDCVNSEPQALGASIYIPFAAVIQAPEQVLTLIGNDSKTAVSAFLRYSEMSMLTNVLNRPGIIAFKGIEKRQATEVRSLENWKSFVDTARMHRVARKIY